MNCQTHHVTLPPRCPRCPRCPRFRRGLIMPLVLIAMGISMILGLAFLSTASTASATASGTAARLNARMIAESGIAVAQAQIDADPAWRTTFDKKTQWVAAQPLGGGTFSIEVEDGDSVDASGKVIGDGKLDDDDQDPVVITCVGVYGDTRHRVRAVRRLPAPTGIAVVERVSLRKNALVDSYDPKFPYTAATATSRAVASSNGISRKPYILFYDRSRVNGDVYYGPGGSLASSVRQDATAIVTGTIGPLPMAIERPEVVEPLWPGASVGDRSYSSGVTTLTGDLWCDRLTLSGSATLRIVGNVTLRVDDNMLVTDDARIQLGQPVAYAAATKGAITIQDNGFVDSFDSTLGPYGGANATADATLATNATNAGSVGITLGTVRGNVLTGVGSNPNTAVIVAAGTLTGTRGALTAPLTIPAPPAWPNGVGNNIGNYDKNSGTHVLAGNLQTDSFRVVGSAVLQVSGNRVVRVNREFTLDDTARIEILPNSSLTVYVAEFIKLNGNGSNVNTGDPSKLVFHGMGADQPHTIDESARVYAVIDAPNSSLTVTGSGQLFGAFMGKSLVVKSNGKFHADRNPAIPTANARLPMTFSTGNKLTIYTQKNLTVSKNARFNCDMPNPSDVQIYHLAGEPFRITDGATGYANVYVRENTLEISGNSRWTGRIRTRDLTVSNNAVVTADASGGSGDPGIAVEETVELRDQAVLDPVSGSGAALLASHGATDTTIRLEHNSVFKGDAYTTPGGYPNDEIRVANSATLTGRKGALDVPVDISAPPAPNNPGSPPDHNYTGSSTTVLSGDVFGRHFTVRDDATIEIDGVTRIILSGDLRFSKRAKLKLRPYAKLTVFCPGWVLFEDDVQINLDGNPTRVTFACGGTNYRILFLVDDAKVCGTILAPAADLLLWDRGEFFGAYRGKRLIMDKDSKMHCSEDGPVPITWLEQQ